MLVAGDVTQIADMPRRVCGSTMNLIERVEVGTRGKTAVGQVTQLTDIKLKSRFVKASTATHWM